LYRVSINHLLQDQIEDLAQAQKEVEIKQKDAQLRKNSDDAVVARVSALTFITQIPPDVSYAFKLINQTLHSLSLKQQGSLCDGLYLIQNKFKQAGASRERQLLAVHSFREYKANFQTGRVAALQNDRERDVYHALDQLCTLITRESERGVSSSHSNQRP
jgi:hypothetical protein